MGLDYGDRTVGVAISDPFCWTAQGVEVIRRKEDKNLKKTIERIRELVYEYEIGTIVLGYPVNMNNSQGFRCEATSYFKDRLEREVPEVQVILKDERLSTMGAERSLLEAGLSRQKRNQVIDKMAAVYILQGYLDHMKIE